MGIRIRVAGLVAAALLAPGAGTAAAEDLSGVDALRAKDSLASTILLGDRSFAVTAETVIRLPNGKPIALAELDLPDLAHGQSDPVLGVRLGRYQGVDDGHRLVLRSLDLVRTAD